MPKDRDMDRNNNAVGVREVGERLREIGDELDRRAEEQPPAPELATQIAEEIGRIWEATKVMAGHCNAVGLVLADCYMFVWMDRERLPPTPHPRDTNSSSSNTQQS